MLEHLVHLMMDGQAELPGSGVWSSARASRLWGLNSCVRCTEHRAGCLHSLRHSWGRSSGCSVVLGGTGCELASSFEHLSMVLDLQVVWASPAL